MAGPFAARYDPFDFRPSIASRSPGFARGQRPNDLPSRSQHDLGPGLHDPASKSLAIRRGSST